MFRVFSRNIIRALWRVRCVGQNDFVKMILVIWLSVHWDWRLLVRIAVSFGSVGCALVNSLALRIWDGFLWFSSVQLVLLSSFLFIIDSFGSGFSARGFQC